MIHITKPVDGFTLTLAGTSSGTPEDSQCEAEGCSLSIEAWLTMTDDNEDIEQVGVCRPHAWFVITHATTEALDIQ